MEERAKALRKLRVAEDQRYIVCDMSRSLRNRLDELWEHAQDCLEGGGSRRRGFAVVGDSGTGKSTSLRHALESMDDLRPYQTEFNERKIPLVTIEVPRTCTTKDLGLRILAKLGQEQVEDPKGNEEKLYNTVKEQLKASGTIFLHFDEAQHLLRSGSDKAIQGLQDRFKSLLKIDDWPLHLILSGVGELGALFSSEDQQLPNRSSVMRFENLQHPNDDDQVKTLLSNIVVDHCKLGLSPSLLTADFLGRLIHATSGGRGTMIEMIRAATYKALSKDHKEVTPKDFEWFYGRISGCLLSDNIFTSKDWQMIVRKNAVADLVPQQTESKRGRKAYS